MFDREYIIDSFNVIGAEITITTITHHFDHQIIYQKYSIYQQEKRIVKACPFNNNDKACKAFLSRHQNINKTSRF